MSRYTSRHDLTNMKSALETANSDIQSDVLDEIAWRIYRLTWNDLTEHQRNVCAQKAGIDNPSGARHRLHDHDPIPLDFLIR